MTLASSHGLQRIHLVVKIVTISRILWSWSFLLCWLCWFLSLWLDSLLPLLELVRVLFLWPLFLQMCYFLLLLRMSHFPWRIRSHWLDKVRPPHQLQVVHSNWPWHQFQSIPMWTRNRLLLSSCLAAVIWWPLSSGIVCDILYYLCLCLIIVYLLLGCNDLCCSYSFCSFNLISCGSSLLCLHNFPWLSYVLSSLCFLRWFLATLPLLQRKFCGCLMTKYDDVHLFSWLFCRFLVSFLCFFPFFLSLALDVFSLHRYSASFALNHPLSSSWFAARFQFNIICDFLPFSILDHINFRLMGYFDHRSRCAILAFSFSFSQVACWLPWIGLSVSHWKRRSNVLSTPSFSVLLLCSSGFLHWNQVGSLPSGSHRGSVSEASAFSCSRQ